MATPCQRHRQCHPPLRRETPGGRTSIPRCRHPPDGCRRLQNHHPPKPVRWQNVVESTPHFPRCSPEPLCVDDLPVATAFLGCRCRLLDGRITGDRFLCCRIRRLFRFLGRLLLRNCDFVWAGCFRWRYFRLWRDWRSGVAGTSTGPRGRLGLMNRLGWWRRISAPSVPRPGGQIAQDIRGRNQFHGNRRVGLCPAKRAFENNDPPMSAACTRHATTKFRRNLFSIVLISGQVSAAILPASSMRIGSSPREALSGLP